LETVKIIEARDYDLAATLTSGQAFRWRRNGQDWSGVVGGNWVGLRQEHCLITAQTARTVPDWTWLVDYLQTHVNLIEVLNTFPDDEPMRAAVAACRGLRLLRQNTWECLASFILSSTKQIVQIQQIVELLCERFGEPIATPPGHPLVFGFPSAERLAGVNEVELRACKMGFRAPYLREAATAIVSGHFNPGTLSQLPTETARAELMKLKGVGAKIADCVLLFAGGFPSAFPVDVWVMKALRQLYFPRRRVSAAQLRQFTESYFGPNAGYAQQYLFHYMRTKRKDK
jgi:N-glycosylase/DNA lyase